MQSQVWTDDKGYWFLNILATHPDSQGKGIGGALVRHVARMVYCDVCLKLTLGR